MFNSSIILFILLYHQLYSPVFAGGVKAKGNSQVENQQSDGSDIYLDTQPRAKASGCHQTSCSETDDCCTGYICAVKRNQFGPTGRCVLPEGSLCSAEDYECHPGLQCTQLHQNYEQLGVCRNPNRIYKMKQYFEPCFTTAECDTQRGLCCRVQNSHGKIGPRTICSYFENPLDDCVF